ncbi:alginate lyase family protein [Natronomonas amylolytica]|uniref:alginate lyase family protein n=1 Tax=Natronomonas amylolytica TaxID=3108498 RepID=UPI0030091926
MYERRVPEDPSVHLDAIAENTATLRECIDEQTRARYRRRTRRAAEGTPDFLNRSLRIAEGTDVNWYDDRLGDYPIDWRLKLYAFQPLSWLCCGFEPGEADSAELQWAYDGWIEDWMESVHIGGPNYLRRAWTPWSVSLRVIFWSRYLAWRETNGQTTVSAGFERSFRREVYKNALFLNEHVERDVGGNHLIENGAALVVAGVLFEEPSWVDRGKSILSETATEQFLDDGFHFERSPMYHILTLTRYLTTCDLLNRSQIPISDELNSVAREATEFLKFLRPPNGHIPLLNDSVYNQALPLESCLRYANALGFDKDLNSPQQMLSSHRAPTKESSGYYWLRTNNGAMLIDGGPVGPPHLPGHSHSDTLSVLLWINDRPIATDTGTFGYDSGHLRQYARGVQGHNTVQVGDTEPIAIGGKYLMGPRTDPTVRFQEGPISLFEGRYEAKPFGGRQYTHHRAAFAGDDWWIVWDSVSNHDGLSICSPLHLHPDITASLESGRRVRLESTGVDAYVYPLEATRADITTEKYFPRFGVATDRSALRLSVDTNGTERTALGFLVTRRDLAGSKIETTYDESSLTYLELADDRYQLPEPLLIGGEYSKPGR